MGARRGDGGRAAPPEPDVPAGPALRLGDDLPRARRPGRDGRPERVTGAAHAPRLAAQARALVLIQHKRCQRGG